MLNTLWPILIGETVKQGRAQVRASKGLLTSKSTVGAILAGVGYLSQHFGWGIAPEAAQSVVEGVLMAGGGLLTIFGLRSATLPMAAPRAPAKSTRGKSRKPSPVKAEGGAPKRKRRTKAQIEADKAAATAAKSVGDKAAGDQMPVLSGLQSTG